ncbi:hypothetical protein SBOR_0015 [Sclerotinia borealis F-4128]|uniref:2EXR domain-containing protein n=1 Tax=Sclerotinia borealis (strain F-4128) TaxID=1432307 RepID=W9CY57_SCLBF|nr:hypothetical protein SBOR_0015 [Sclerotinia borealis F-4128]
MTAQLNTIRPESIGESEAMAVVVLRPHIMKPKLLFSVHAFGQRLKRHRSDSNIKSKPNIELTPMDINSQEKVDIRICETFTLFLNLPLELQRKIWEFAAIPRRRTIEARTPFGNGNICTRITSIGIFFGVSPRIPSHTVSTCAPTGLLHTCHEARNVAMRNYSFLTFFDRPLYCNEDIDVLWLRGDPIPVFKSMRGNFYNTPIMHGRGRSRGVITSKFQFRHLAIDFNSFIPHLRYLWLSFWTMKFWDFYVFKGYPVEKIYVVYTTRDQEKEAIEEATHLVRTRMEFMREFSHYPGLSTEERMERIQLEIQTPVVEAILDTDLDPYCKLKPKGKNWLLEGLRHKV